MAPPPDIHHRSRLKEAGILELANDKCIVAFALGAHGVADYLAGAMHFDDRVGAGIVRLAAPRCVEFVGELRTTESGKVQKYKFTERGITQSTWDCEAAGYTAKRIWPIFSGIIDSTRNHFKIEIIAGAGSRRAAVGGHRARAATILIAKPANTGLAPTNVDLSKGVQKNLSFVTVQGRRETTMRKYVFGLTALVGLSVAATASHAQQITVGFVTSLSGPASSIGLNYEKGMNAAYAWQGEINGQKIKLIKLDDGSDPSAATKNARKLVEQDHVDVMIGTSSAPGTNAMLTVANELKVPFIGVSPVNVALPTEGHPWGISMVQTPQLMVKVIADRMKRDGIKSVGYIGFSDSWGDLVYNGAKAAEANGGPAVLTNERYARTDTSVTAQALKVVAAKPDGFLDGGSATQGALPLLELRKLGYQGPFFGTPSLLNRDFIRIGGKAAEGAQVSAGPVVVTSQLPDGHFAKKIGTAFHESFKKVNGGVADDGFSGYAFDGWVVFLEAAKVALTKAKPGTPEFREALMQAIYSSKDIAGVHAVYNFTPKSYYGVDERSLVVVKLVNGNWVYQP